MWRGSIITLTLIALFASPALAASDKQPAPPGTFSGAPGEYTHFTAAEFRRGFLALAFGSDLRIGAKPRGIRRFDRPVRVQIVATGSVDRSAAMARIVEEYARKVPSLQVSIAPPGEPGDIEVRLIDEKAFRAALQSTFGAEITRTFIRRTNPQCMTSVKSAPSGAIERTVSFIIVDKGDDVFLDCGYHELLHAFGLSNHDQRNPWTTLNQKRMVGYLTVYDRGLLTLLYDPRIRPGMTEGQVRAVLPRLIDTLGLVAPAPKR